MNFPRYVWLTNTLAALLLGNTAYATGTTWTGGSGDFGTAGNWSNGVPTASVTPATIQGGGDAVLGANYTIGQLILGQTSSSAGSTVDGTGTLTTSGVTVNGTNNLITSGVTMTGNITQSASSGFTVNGTVGADSMASGASLAGTGSVGTLTLAGNNNLSSTGTLKVGVGGSSFSISGTGNTFTGGNLLFLSFMNVSGTISQSGGDLSEGASFNNFLNGAGDYVISGGTVGAHGAFSLFIGNGGGGTLDVVGTGATSITLGALSMSSTTGTVQFDLGATGVTPISTGLTFGSNGIGTLQGILTINGASYATAPTATATIIPLISTANVLTAGFTTVNVNGINGVVTYTANGGKEVALVLDGTAYYFTGTTSNSLLTPGNFNDMLTGGTTHNFAPSSTSDLYLAANSPGNLPATFGASNVTIHSLNFNANGAGSSLAGTGTVTLGSSATALSDTATGGTTETVSPGVVLGASQTWSVTNSTNKLSVSGLVSDGGNNYALTKTGAGSLVLSNTGNTFGGAVAVQAGTLTFGNGNVSATAAQSLGENSSLTLGVASTSSGVLQYNGTGAATLAKGISALGNGSDTIQNSGTGLLTLSGGLVKNGTTLTLNGGSSGITVTGTISGSSANSDLDITGGTTTISTLATYNGPTWIYGSGVLVNGVSVGALPAGTSINIGTPGAAGAATSTSTTAGTFDLGGNNQTVAGLNTEGTGPSYTSDIVTNNGSSNATLTVTSGGTFAGVIKNGATNSTALRDFGGTLSLSGVNTYTGSTAVQGGGTLVLANSSNTTLANTSTVTLGESSGNTSGILQLGNGTNASSQTLASLTTSGTGSSNAVVGGNASVSTLTINNSSADAFSGILGGAGTNQNKLALVKSNSGTLTLSGADTYTGGTTINGGTLLSANATGLGGTSGTLAVNGGGVLDIDNIGQTVGVTTLGLTSSSLGSTIQSTGGTVTLATGGVTVNGTNNLIASSVTMTGNITQSASSGLTVNGTVGADSMASGASLAGTGSVGTLTLSGNNTLSSSGTLKVGVGGSSFSISGTGNTFTGGNLLFLSFMNVSGTISQSGGDLSEGAPFNNFLNGAGDYVISGGTVGAHGAFNLFIGNGGGGTLDVVGTGATSITLGALSMSSTTGTVQFDLGATGVTPISTGLTFGSGSTGTLQGILTINGASYTTAPSATATIIPLISTSNVLTAGFTTVNVNGINGVVTYTANGGKEVALQLDGTAYYFTGTTSNSFLTAGNFKDTLTGGTTHNFAPSSTSDVYLAANSAANLPATIGSSNVTIHSLNFNANGAGSSLAGTGTVTLSSSGTALSDTATGGTTETVNPNVALGASQTWSVSTSANTLSVGGQVSDGGSGYALTKAGAGSLALSGANTYTGGTTVSAGKLFVNNAGGASYTAPTSSANRTITPTNSTSSATGTAGVTVNNGGTLAGSGTIKSTSGGVTVNSGGTLASGGVQSGTTAGVGLTINNAANLTSALIVNGGATLTFDLGSTTAYNGGSGALNFANPNTNSTYMSLTGLTADQIFANTTTADNINLVDLTNGALTGVSLTLRAQNPYLLIQTALGNNADFANLWTTGGEGQNGYVLGISTGVGNAYTAFNLAAYDLNGNRIDTSSNLQNLRLYLYNGDLEVVPEPGTWALMLGGLGLLILIQRRRNKQN